MLFPVSEKKYKCRFEGCAYACTDTIGLDKHIKLMHTHKVSVLDVMSLSNIQIEIWKDKALGR